MSNETVKQWWEQKRAAQAKAVEVHRFTIKAEIFPSCLNCDSWAKDGTEVCNKYKARPPADVIVFSCGQWEADIPF